MLPILSPLPVGMRGPVLPAERDLLACDAHPLWDQERFNADA
jgi:hypothetical protein